MSLLENALKVTVSDNGPDCLAAYRAQLGFLLVGLLAGTELKRLKD